MERRATLVVNSALDNLPLAVAAVRGMCREHLADPATSNLVEIAVLEACTNSARHAGGAGRPFQLDVLVTDDRIEFVLTDEGPAYDFDARRMPAVDGVPIEALPEGGFGVPLIKSIMDVAEYRRDAGRNVLRLVKRRPAPGGER
jgi:serine/threonine-protein kinase RsbW